MRQNISLVKVLLIVSLFFHLLAQGISLFPESPIKVEITTPERDGIEVGREMDVKGTAVIPLGNYLWILVHRTKGFKRVWWPQNEAEIDPVTKKWEVHVMFGMPRDIGYEFEIAAIVVNEEEHRKLQDYWEKAMQSADWRPILMPLTVTAPTIKSVRKTKH
jgi:hypothetical protein